MNKQSNLEYYLVSMAVALAGVTAVVVINSNVSGILERFLWILLSSMVVFTASKFVRKGYGRDAFNSKRSALHAFLLILIRAAVFATGAVALVAVFLGNGDTLVMDIEGTVWINVNYLARYVVVYAVIYALAYLITSLVLVNV